MFFLKIFFEPKVRKNERRRSERVDLRDLVKVDFQTDMQKPLFALGVGKDISMTGIRFATFAPLKPGDELYGALHFFKLFPGVKRISIKMRVVRVYKPIGSRRFRVGAEFVQSPDYKADFDVLAQFIDWLKSQTK